MPSRFEFSGVRGYADPADPWSYYFLPSHPDLRRDSAGHPMITLIDAGSSGYVMFTATWRAMSASLEALRQKIATTSGESDASRIQLSFAPLSGLECHALLRDDAGTFQTVATSSTSGMPPYDAVFNLSIPQTQKANVARALKGESGFLAIDYVGDLLLPGAASAVFRSESDDLQPWLRKRRSSQSTMRALLLEAVEIGLASVRIEGSEHTSPEIRKEVFERVLLQAAEVAPRWISEEGRGQLEVLATLEREMPEPVEAFADIGGIVASGATLPS